MELACVQWDEKKRLGTHDALVIVLFTRPLRSPKTEKVFSVVNERKVEPFSCIITLTCGQYTGYLLCDSGLLFFQHSAKVLT